MKKDEVEVNCEPELKNKDEQVTGSQILELSFLFPSSDYGIQSIIHLNVNE